MTSSSRFSLSAACLFATLLAGGCGGRNSSESQPATREAATAPELTPGQKADNAATEKVETDRNDKQAVDDEKTHATYVVTTRDRLANIDKELAKVAASKNAPGLRTRRDELAGRLAKMPPRIDSTWVAYTSEVGSLFDGIERDLRSAR